ncbi:unnamed protein product [Somion occarium]|uniref:Flavin reductase like domain-containing protein n=1 Tax=Somion occarium TaxID=3059160 RepID=A0ABP1D9J9_9APHY
MASRSSDLPAFTESTFQYTQPPNPSFKFGQKVDATPEGKAWADGEKEGWKVIETDKEDPMKLYPLMISAITPRPVAFVSTISDTGVENLGLMSWFNMVTAYPALISISVAIVNNKVKDTTRNILATKEFTVNIISVPWIDNANACSIDAPADVSEWALSGLTKAPSVHVKPPRVKESAFSMECELFQTIDITHPESGVKSTTLILGRVKYIHVRRDTLNERGNVDPDKLKPIGRLGDILYASLGGGFRIPRPSWAVEGENVLELEKEDAGIRQPSGL